MQSMWLYSVCQCVLYMSVIGLSVRMCVGRGRRSWGEGDGSISECLRICLCWVGAVGSALAIPVSVLLDLRTPQCLYTCLTLVCCPLLVRQFTMCLLLLLTLDSHLQYRLGERYPLLVSRRQALLVVLVSWVGSVLTAFAQFISWNVLDTWGQSLGGGLAGLGLGGVVGTNWTTPVPPPKYPGPQDRSIIGRYLPYGGFLSKFYMENQHNFTYAEIHGNHWGVCAADTVLSPAFLVYVYGVTAFLFPLLALLIIYLDLLCIGPKLVSGLSQAPKSQVTQQSRSLALSLSLLVLLCLPLHTSNALLLFSPSTLQPRWVPVLTSLLFQLYGLVPPLLHTPPASQDNAQHTARPPHQPSLPQPVSPGKEYGATQSSNVQCCSICCSPWGIRKVKVCPQV